MNLNLNDVICGFRVIAKREIAEIDAVMVEMRYEKNGAQLIYLDRADSNKTFAIAFKTIPSDNTGVFHIIEHSVLNGSEKYPTKEPFVDLLKGSLQTFLNAFTYPDKTVYPVCSRNDQDFLNLVDVYMDAVLHPAILHTPNIYRQEGWHFELADENAELTYNGVVFNEMKGAYSSVDSVVWDAMDRQLFPDTCYGFSSGGDPEAIPDLTYEQFLACHQKYYHPSNSRIFLDGTMDLETVLGKLDSFLCAYDYLEVDADIPLQKPVSYTEVTKEYEIAEGEEEAGKARIALGCVSGSYAEKEKNIAMIILSDILCGHNESPLKKAILDAELGEDITFDFSREIQQTYVVMTVSNTDADKKEIIEKTITSTLTDLAENGIDRELLIASFNNLEFNLRERDYGTTPRGLIFGLSALESWLYDGDPAQNLTYDDVFAPLREKIEQNYFEKLIRDVLLNNTHRAVVIAVPSKTLGDEKRQKEAARLADIRAGWDEETVRQTVEDSRLFAQWQAREDTPEQLAMLPSLELSSIAPEPEQLPLAVSEEQGVTVLRHEVSTSGIVYADLYFSAEGLTADELSAASFLCDILCHTATETYDSLALQNQIMTNLGGLYVYPTVFAKAGETENCRPSLVVSTSLLESRTDEAIHLIDEVLNHSRFDDSQLILNLLRQRKMNTEQSLVMSGNSFAAGRVAACLTASGAANEYIGGFEHYRWMKKTESNYEESAKALSEQFVSLCRRIFTRENLTVSITGREPEGFTGRLIELLPSVKNDGEKTCIPPFGVRHEGIVVPAGVSFAVAGANLYGLGSSYSGQLLVAAKLLSLGYLWNEIRVKGGAYGAGFYVRPGGMANFYSYRDPSAANSLECYAKAAEFLQEFCAGEEDLTKFIIGTIGDSEPLLSPRTMGRVAASRYLTGVSHEDSCRLRKEILSTTREDLLGLCDTMRAITEKGALCVVGGKDKLDACGDQLTEILTM